MNMGLNLAEWQAEYESGDRLIDEQHQSLFSIINSLNQAMLGGIVKIYWLGLLLVYKIIRKCILTQKKNI